jgi:hypothetical protein
MRQVSALGMEDPVFRTMEQGPPHHPSNIYDDMGITHLPVDMMDMVSVASDPTATLHEGFLDLTLFQQSLANSSLLESSTAAAALHSLNSSLLHGGNVTAAAAPVSPEQPMIVSTNTACPMDIVTTTRPLSQRDQASQRGNGTVEDITAPILVPHHRSRNHSTAIMTTHWNQALSSSSPIKSETTRSQTSYASSYLQQQHRKEKGHHCEPMGASLPSLDLDAVFAHQVATSTVPTTIPIHHSAHHHPTNNTDLLLAEAAQALEQQGHGSSSAACAALIQAAKRQQQPHQPQSHQQPNQHHQYHRQYSAPPTQSAAAAAHHVSCSTLKHTSTTNVQPSRSSSTNGTRKVSRRHSTGVVPVVSDVETTHTSSKNTSSSSSRSRCLPTLESLFPDAAAATTRKAALLPPMRTDSSDSNFSLLMLSGPPPSFRGGGGSRSARRSSAHGGLFGAAHTADTSAAASKWLR